jgi:hypothetical protein
MARANGPLTMATSAGITRVAEGFARAIGCRPTP